MKTKKINITGLLILFPVSLIVFILCITGFVDVTSLELHKFLYSKLGYTTNQGFAFGPLWFYYFNSNIGNLGSKEVFILISIFYIGLLYFTKHTRSLRLFFWSGLVGISILLAVKFLYNDYSHIISFLGTDEYLKTFPSGHAYTATLLYLSIYFTSKRFVSRPDLRKFMLFFFIFLIITIGISRLLGGNHSLTEVLGGWSLGLLWISTFQITVELNSYLKINTHQ